MNAAEDRYAGEWEGLLDNLPAFAVEMPEHALADYLNPDICTEPLPTGLPPAMPFDSELLPESLRGYVRDAAERMQGPPDFIAVSLIVALSGVVGCKYSIHPKQRDDWRVLAAQWAAIIGVPSTMKTPCLNTGMAQLYRLEAKERDKHKQAMTEHKATSEVLDLERKAAKDKAKKLVGEGKKDAAVAELSKFADDIPAPAQRRYIVNDSTVEKLGELMNETNNGMTVVRDEGYGWLAKMQSDEGAVDRAFYLESFNGTGSFTYDRIGRGTVFIESCCLSLIIGIQPSRIATLVRGAVTGQLDDGLVQRLQLAVWPDAAPDWTLIDRWPNKGAKDRVDAIFDDLDQLPDEPRQTLRFTLDAQELFNTWYTEHMLEIRSGDFHPAMQSHFMKMPKTIAGLALLFELIDGGRDAVGVEATARALDWADYLKSHAGRLYGAAINAPLMGAQLILERKDKLPEPFTPREIRSKKWGGLDTTEAVNDALEVLTEHRTVVPYQVAAESGGRPSKRYVWRRAV